MTEWRWDPSKVLVTPGKLLVKVREHFTTKNGERWYKFTDPIGRPFTERAVIVERDYKEVSTVPDADAFAHRMRDRKPGAATPRRGDGVRGR